MSDISNQTAGTVRAKFHHALKQCIVGLDAVSDLCLIALIAGEHALIESAPGLAKTTLIKAIAKLTACDFGRIQFTPDLLPLDLLGTEIFIDGDFTLRKGVVFCNVLLCDEINRAPAKIQSALLQVMAEKEVTIGPQTLPMADVFSVFATQNPIESSGVYELPEAELDRFMFKLLIDYPSFDQEVAILTKGIHTDANLNKLQPLLTQGQLLQLRASAKFIKTSERVLRYIATLVRETRATQYFSYGASPRGGIMLLKGAQVLALLEGVEEVHPEHIRKLFIPTLMHRCLGEEPEVIIEILDRISDRVAL